MRLLLATRNPHKLGEFRRLLADHDLCALPAQVALPPETAETFEGNALSKARAGAAACAVPTIADDSGIEAESLVGAPGVRSARYAGPSATDAQNLAKLLHEAPPDSAVTYVCALAWVDPSGGEERVFVERCRGRLAPRARGAGGFGYDPAFLPDEGPNGLTMAELEPAQKDAISHRGRAARALQAWLVA